MRVRNVIAILILAVFLAACGGKPNESIFSRDETVEAAEFVDAGNRKLKLIKKRFKDNEPRYDELKAALKSKDEAKVRTLSNEFVDQISAGTQEGNEAIELLQRARDMNINSDFRQYLDLKIASLEKYVEAFEQRRQAAKLLAEGYDPKDASKRDRVIAEFKQKEERFNEIIEEGRQSSQDANDLAKESLRKKP